MSRQVQSQRHLAILGSRGIPAQHGGFETFAEYLALYLAEQGWKVSVYCQEDGSGPARTEMWRGVERVVLPVDTKGAAGTLIFDWKAISHALKARPLVLTLGYNSAIYSYRFRLRRMTEIINMDGIEWHRQKWSLPAKIWLYLNERFASLMGTHLVADHPEIARHHERNTPASKITMIPYGADAVTEADASHLERWNLTPRGYLMVVARAEPENSILEIVEGFSRKRRNVTLLVLGKYDFDNDPYHQRVRAAASEEVCFAGGVYEPEVVKALRFYCRLHIHGHQVGGTNPSLVEALGAGSAIVAHDNRFNRWVTGGGARFFTDADGLDAELDALLDDEQSTTALREASRARHAEAFTWPLILEQYRELLERYLR